MSVDLISFDGVGKTYGEEGEVPTVALKKIDFVIKKNKEAEFVAIMGPSGSGKSTLLHILGLLDTPTAGEYRLLGKSISHYSEDELAHLRNRTFGFVFQSFNLLARTSVIDNVQLPLLYSKIPKSEWQDRALAAIENVKLSHRIDHEPSELSGGEKQRAAIARALVTDPDIILADEPTGNLDSKSGEIIMDSIAELNENKGKTVILITHETYAASYAKRLITLLDGEVEKDEPIKKRHVHSDGYKK